jgi:DNA-binding GntR family transcriptional regulator
MAPTTVGHGGEGDTLSERAATILERDILAGRLKPGSRLAIT